MSGPMIGLVAAFGCACLASFLLGWHIANARRSKCPDVQMCGLTFDGCDYRVVEEWRDATVEVSRCRRCGAVDVSWKRQDNSVCVYKEAGDGEVH